jgi:PEP-CTERM/exosortase A-associated glycosyltransferase
MRILHVFDHSLPLQSGYVTRSLGIIRSQRARGWNTIHLTAPRHAAWTQQRAESESFDDLTFHRTAPSSIKLTLPRSMREMHLLSGSLRDLVKRERPDIIHAHSPVLNALPAIAVARQFRIPVAYEVRAFWEDAAVDLGRSREGSPRYRLARYIDTFAMRHADAVLPLCEPMRLDMEQRGISAEKLTVVPNAVEERFFAPPTSDGSDVRSELGLENRFVIGFIGSFYSYEGLDLLLDALGRVASTLPNVCLLLVGGGPDEARLRATTETSGLQQRVRLLGRVRHEDVARYYQACDLFVFPRRKMRLTELVTPLKPLETMAQSKPVAASDVGGHRELIRQGDTGYLFPADDAAALATTLCEIVADAPGRALIARNGRRYVEAERRWSSVSARYATVYNRLLANAQTRRPSPSIEARTRR